MNNVLHAAEMTEVVECQSCLLSSGEEAVTKDGLVSWRQLCMDCEQQHLTRGLLIPHERVRLCSDSIQ